MKIGICNELFQGWPIAQIFEYAARLGYGGVEIAPFTLADSVRDISSGKRKEIRRAAEEQGIEIIGLHWLLVKPEGAVHKSSGTGNPSPHSGIFAGANPFLRGSRGKGSFPRFSEAENDSGGLEFRGGMEESPGDL